MKRIGLVLIAFVLMVLPLISQIRNVPADHSTIQEAINESVTGDTILVAEGTYFENINFNGRAVTLASQFLFDGDTSHISRTIIDGSQPARLNGGMDEGGNVRHVMDSFNYPSVSETVKITITPM